MDKEELEKMRDELALNFSNHLALDYQDARAFKHGWNTVVDILWPEIEDLKILVRAYEVKSIVPHMIDPEVFAHVNDELTKANEEKDRATVACQMAKTKLTHAQDENRLLKEEHLRLKEVISELKALKGKYGGC